MAATSLTIPSGVPILAAKTLFPPVQPGWVTRRRLIDRLESSLQGKLTLVSAPAGFGKTTLIASWLHSLSDRATDQHGIRKIAWLTLEQDDNNPVRFFTYFIAALQSIDPAVGAAALHLLETPRLPKFDHLMTLLLADLAGLEGRAVIVLDDYHWIDDPALQSAVAFFLDHLPSQCHLVIATREEPRLPLPRLRVHSEVTEIRLHDLRFSTVEVGEFLNQRMGLTVTADAARMLQDRTEGWVAALQMAGLSMRGSQHEAGDTAISAPDKFAGSRRDVIDYLATEALRRQPDEVRSWLYQTGILDRLNASLCDAVTGTSGSGAMLGRLESANLFLIPLDDRRHYYRYHHLFADFLRTQLPQDEQHVLHLRASQWYLEHGLPTEAIKHALAGGDPAAAVRVVRRNVEETVRNGGFTTILGWMDALPEHIVRAHTDLLVHKGWLLYLRGEIVEAETYARLAIENQQPDDPPIHRGMLLVFRAYLANNQGQVAQGVKLAQESLELLGNTESFYRTSAMFHLGEARHLSGDQQAAIRTLRQCVTLAQRFGHHLMGMVALGYLTQSLSQSGQLREAIMLCEDAIAKYKDSAGHPLPVAGLVHGSAGILYYYADDLDRAYQHLTIGIALCRQLGIIVPAVTAQCVLARLHFARGETELGWQTIASARHLAGQSGSDRLPRHVEAVAAEIQLREGHTVAAALAIATWPGAADNRSEGENLTVARLLLKQGRPREAHGLLERLERSARRRERFGSLITVYILQACAHQALNHSGAATRYIEQAIGLAAPEHQRRAFLDESVAIAPLLRRCRDVAPAFVSGLLDALSKPPESAASRTGQSEQPQPLIEPLSKAQLRILRLVAEGLSNRDIAITLAITEGTTKWQLNQIYSKLNVSRRTQAVAQARQLKLI